MSSDWSVVSSDWSVVRTEGELGSDWSVVRTEGELGSDWSVVRTEGELSSDWFLGGEFESMFDPSSMFDLDSHQEEKRSVLSVGETVPL